MNYTFPNQIIGFGMIDSDNMLFIIFYGHIIHSIGDFKGSIVLYAVDHHWEIGWKAAVDQTIVKNDFFANEMIQTEFLDRILIRWN